MTVMAVFIAVGTSLFFYITQKFRAPKQEIQLPPAGSVSVFLVDGLIGCLVSQIHDPIAQDSSKEVSARFYYSVIFSLWLCKDQGGGGFCSEDLDRIMKLFSNHYRKYGLDRFLDLDDPLRWGDVPEGVSREDLSNSIGGNEYAVWVRKTTAARASYEMAVSRFRKAMEALGTDKLYKGGQ